MMTTEITAAKPFKTSGEVFSNPENPAQGYRLTRDVFLFEHVTPDMFEPIGGAPKPVAGEAMPEWFAKQVMHG